MDTDIQILLERLAKLEQTLIERDEEIVRLRAQLNQNSSNSHRPPSSDLPNSSASKKRRGNRQRKRSRRSRGGQPGHKGTTRQKVGVSKIDRFEECTPDACDECGAHLFESDFESQPERHQVTELPPIQPEVIEYVLHACSCRKCGARTKARLPDGVSWSAFGPRIHALVVSLNGQLHASRRRTQMALKDWFDLKISLGAISDMEQRVSRAMSPVVNEAAAQMRASSLPTGMDETGWRQAGKRRWLWTAITEKLVLFAIRESRGSKVVTELVGKHAGDRIIITDRWSAYFTVPLERRQFCWAHLMRDFKKMAESGEPEAMMVGSGLMSLGAQMFRWWNKVRTKELSRTDFQNNIDVLKPWVLACLERGVRGPHKKSAGVCKQLKEKQISLWTFAYNKGVEPTNNHSERALRQAVIWRKISNGSQSNRGTLYVERILTIIASLQLQGRNVFSFLLDVIHAGFSNSDAPPTLLPSPMST